VGSSPQAPVRRGQPVGHGLGSRGSPRRVADGGGGERRPARRITTRGRAAPVVAYGEENVYESRKARGFPEE
jgi:hypothetical protein